MKIITYAMSVITWWIIGSVLSAPIVKWLTYAGLFASDVMVRDKVSYALLVFTPFILSFAIAAIIVGIIMPLVLSQENSWFLSILLVAFGSVPFVVMSSYQDGTYVIVLKALLLSICVLGSHFAGVMIGNKLKDARHGR